MLGVVALGLLGSQNWACFSSSHDGQKTLKFSHLIYPVKTIVILVFPEATKSVNFLRQGLVPHTPPTSHQLHDQQLCKSYTLCHSATMWLQAGPCLVSFDSSFFIAAALRNALPPQALTWMLSSTFFHWEKRVNLSLKQNRREKK